MAFSASIVFAQSNNEGNSNYYSQRFVRKGRVLVESGYNLIGGLPIGAGTGIISISDGDNSVTGIGFNGGYFISQNFALKLSLTNLGDSDVSLSSFGIGAKYLVAGKVPIDFIIGSVTVDGGNNGDITFTTLSIGYGIRLADNINLEPSIGVYGTDDDNTGLFSMNFSMFL